jgi:putative oxidoreductase
MAVLFFHNFWAVPPDEAQIQMINFMKNISMMGGLLYVVVHGSGSFSLSHDTTIDPAAEI